MKLPLRICGFFQIAFFLHVSAQTRYLEPVFDGVTVTTDIQYGMNANILTMSTLGEASPQQLFLDLYEPAGDAATSRPLVLVLPDGYFLPTASNGTCDGSKSDSSVVEICTRLAKLGYVAAAVDYRLGWNPVASDNTIRIWTYIHALYRGIQDARTAVRFFKKTAAEDDNLYRVDTSRIVVWGDASGGNVALAAAYARTYDDWIKPKFIIQIAPNTTTPIIIEALDGNIWGTDLGVVPPGIPPAIATPGDTLCYPNWPGYSSDFQLCVSTAGIIPDTSWISPGEIPAVLFHAPNDVFQPCNTNLLSVQPPVALTLMEVSGSCAVANTLDISGISQVFENAGINDCVTANAYMLNGGLEGFYPFVGLDIQKGRPWNWTAVCPNNPNAATDGAFARQYIDTIMAYFAPRACAALALCSGLPTPAGLCTPAVKGKVYFDLNDNGYDAGDPPFPGIVLELQPGNKHAVSGLNGNYLINAPTGSYTLSIPNPPNYFAATNTPADIFIPATGDTVHFAGLKATATVNDLQVTLTPSADAKPGFYNIYTVNWKNVGTTQLSGTVSLTMDPGYNLVNSMPPANIAGATATWDFFNLPPLQQGSAALQVYLPGSVQLGALLSSTVTATPTGVTDNNPADNTATVEQTVIGSFDPNDKRVSPEGDLTETLLGNAGNQLDYTIRFQNTGTASAENIAIVDTLSDLLNINTLELIGASHPVRMAISGQRTVTWFFDHINLPDSTGNEPGSHGFVRYRIQPVQPFSAILNKTAANFADIYFDFNSPIRTNTVETRFVLASSATAPYSTGTVDIAPNPAYGAITVSCTMPEPVSDVLLSICDISGRLMLTEHRPVSGQILKHTVQTGHWPKGIYIVKVNTGRTVYSGRFFRE